MPAIFSQDESASAHAFLAIGTGAFSILYVLYIILSRRKIVFPTQKQHVSATIKTNANATYIDVFPPSQREALAELLPAKEAVDNLNLNSPGVRLLPMNADYRKADPSLALFSGFTVADVKALGDFPDYATLSGVPLPQPVDNFDIHLAKPRPYRPFRWNYHQTMGHFKMDVDFWLELDSAYRERISQRQKLFAEHGKNVLQTLPGSELACKELMEMALQFLCARYPSHFQLEGHVFMNRILQTQEDLKVTEPLIVLLNHVPEDFALVLRDENTGRYVFRAGIICSSVGWNLGQMMGAEMLEIHGSVPDFKEKMSFSVNRFFTKMKTSGPIQRASWGLEIGQPLYLPEDAPEYIQRESQNPNLRLDDVHLRVDWQTLRRLPLSGAVIFNFKAVFTPISEFRDEPYIPSLVLKILNEGNEAIMKYKGTWHVEHVVKPALAEYEKSQIERGLMEAGWEVKTLDDAPFFPGWERKWMDNGGVATKSRGS